MVWWWPGWLDCFYNMIILLLLLLLPTIRILVLWLYSIVGVLTGEQENRPSTTRTWEVGVDWLKVVYT